MNWLYDIFSLVNPWTHLQQLYHETRSGWRRLLTGSSPQARVLLLTGFFWTVPAALTEPFKSIYLTKLGLDAFDLGGVSGLDMGLRSLGVLAGGWLGMRFGHKRTLLWGDFISWVVSSVVLALATHPAHIILWACLMAVNSVVSASFQQLLLSKTPLQARSRAYGFLNLSAVLPGVALPFVASLLLKHFDIVSTMRSLLLFQAAVMGLGIYVRWRYVDDDHLVKAKKKALADRLAAIVKHAAQSPGSARILAFWILANIAGNYWRVYFSIYAVKKLEWSEASLGYYSQLGAFFFVASSLFWLPRLKAVHERRNLFIINALSLLPPLILFLGPGTPQAWLLTLCGGLFAAVNAALTGAVMASILPQDELALAFSLVIALMQLLLGLSFPAAGALFRDHMEAFAVSAVTLNFGQAALAFSLWRTKKPRPVT